MIRVIIGSSNVAMAYKPEKFKAYPPYKMVKCTKSEVFKAVMEEIKEEKEVIIAVIENFICDAVRATPAQSSDLIDGAIEAAIKDYMGVVHRTAKRLPLTRFALAQPILRPRDMWYSERYDELCRSYVASINALGLKNVSKLEALSKVSQTFENDEVHLTKESSYLYVNGLLYNSDTLFSAEIINKEDGTSRKSGRMGEKGEERPMESEFEESVKKLNIRLEELNQSMFNRRFHGSLVMARMREDVDVISNTNKEDKIVILGMSSNIPRPAGRDESRKCIVKTICPS
jgi:hypothetical protein